MNITKQEQRTIITKDSIEDYVIDSLHRSALNINEQINNAQIYVGFEFEFYLDNKTNANISDIISNMLVFAKKIVFCPNECNTNDKDINAWTIELDASLLNPLHSGFEIVTPKLPLKDSIFYLSRMLDIISNYAFTDEGCSLHFHISSENERLQTLDPVKLMLLIDNTKNLSTWDERKLMCKNLLKVFNNTLPEVFKENFSKLDRVYNVSPRPDYSTNHLEVRAIGGEKYHLKREQIFKDFIEFVKNYYSSCNPNHNLDLYEKMLEKFYHDNGGVLKDKFSFDEVLSITKYDNNLTSKDRNSIKIALIETIYEKIDEFPNRLIIGKELERDVINWAKENSNEEDKSISNYISM